MFAFFSVVCSDWTLSRPFHEIFFASKWCEVHQLLKFCSGQPFVSCRAYLHSNQITFLPSLYKFVFFLAMVFPWKLLTVFMWCPDFSCKFDLRACKACKPILHLCDTKWLFGLTESEGFEDGRHKVIVVCFQGSWAVQMCYHGQNVAPVGIVGKQHVG